MSNAMLTLASRSSGVRPSWLRIFRTDNAEATRSWINMLSLSRGSVSGSTANSISLPKNGELLLGGGLRPKRLEEAALADLVIGELGCDGIEAAAARCLIGVEPNLSINVITDSSSSRRISSFSGLFPMEGSREDIVAVVVAVDDDDVVVVVGGVVNAKMASAGADSAPMPAASLAGADGGEEIGRSVSPDGIVVVVVGGADVVVGVVAASKKDFAASDEVSMSPTMFDLVASFDFDSIR